MNTTIASKDGPEIYFKDWGKGPVATSFHGWPLNSALRALVSTFNIVESSHV